VEKASFEPGDPGRVNSRDGWWEGKLKTAVHVEVHIFVGRALLLSACIILR